MKIKLQLRHLIIATAIAVPCFANSQSKMVDVPVGEVAYERMTPVEAPVETKVVETTVSISDSERVPTRRTSRRSSVTTKSPASKNLQPLKGTIGPKTVAPSSTVAPLAPDLDSIRRAAVIDPHLIASIEPSSMDPVEPEPVSDPKSKEVAVYVVDWELSEIVASITSQTGINIVLASTTNPKITVRLDKMPVREVVRIIASLANMQVIQLKSGGFVMAPAEVLKGSFPQEYNDQVTAIATPATANGTAPAKPPVVEEVTDIYDVRNVKPSELVEALTAIFEGDSLKIKLGPGKLLPSAVGGGDSNSSGGGSGNTPTTGNATASLSTGRTLVLRGPRLIVQEALRLAKQLDTKQPQVAIRVQIHDITNDAMRDLGVSWQGTTGSTLTESNSSQNDINFGSFSRSALSFAATLHHLEKTNKAKILAQPNISVLDQEPGYILIGDRINYPVVTSLNSNGQPVFDVREERVGIYLQVSATVNDDNRVTLNLYPQVSAISGFLEVPGQGSYPQISTREAKTSIRIKTGETVVIGGLLRDEEIKAVERVPILGQIPFFGELFTRRKTTKNQSQVIISITPQIIESEQ